MVVVLAGCGTSTPVDLPDAPEQPLSAVGRDFFPDSAVWTTPVSPEAAIDPRSAEYVARLAQLEPVVSVRESTVSVFVATADSPRFTVTPTAPNASPESVLEHVPIPTHAVPDPAQSGHLAVFDRTSRCVYELYGLRQDATGWLADWANTTPADGEGVYPDGLSTRASGLASTAGLIWPDELLSGTIPHALVFSYPFTRRGGPVPPATRTNGTDADPSALPIGAKLVLDPALDLGTLGLGPAELAIATALQRYGMILGDTSEGFQLFAVHARSFPADPYMSTWGDVVWADISAIPFDRMQVIATGDQQPQYQGPPIENRCTGAETGAAVPPTGQPAGG